MRIDTVRDLRRAQIIAAARTLIAEGGLAGLTIGALEKRLGFSRGVITYHFEGKEEIVEAVLDSATREIDRARGAALAGVERGDELLRVILRSTLDGFLQHIEAAHILLSFWSRITSDPEAARKNAALYAGWRQGVAALLQAGIQRGVFVEVPVEPIAALIVGTVLGIAVQVYFEPGAVDPGRAIDEAAEALIARMCPPSKKPVGKKRRSPARRGKPR